MLIFKILNNNAVIARDDDNKEIIVTGRGIAFNKGMYDEIDETLVTGIYELKNDTQKSKFEQLVSEIPYEYIRTSEKIIQLAEEKLEKKLDEGLIIRLTDHIHYSVEKSKKNIVIPNMLINEIQRFYKKEYEIAKDAVVHINEKYNVNLDENEVGFIAFHLASAQDINGSIDTNEMIKGMQRIVKTVEDYFHVNFDIESLNYSRFAVHLKFFMKKMMTASREKEQSLEHDSLYCMLIDKYSDIDRCLDKINGITLLDYNYTLSDSDRMYLIIHLARLIHKN